MRTGGRAAAAASGFELAGETTPVPELVGDVWRSRALLAMLARKDFVVRYRRAAFGLLWAVALPLLQALVLALVLSKIVRFQTGVDYPVFVYSGMVLWTAFSTSLTYASTSIVDAADLSTKIYFPRAVLPLVSVLSNTYGLVVGVVIFLVMAVATGVSLDAGAVLVVPAVLLTLVLTAGFGLVFAALHVYFRDIRYLVQAALIVWFYASPVFYPLTATKNLRPLLELNPMTGVIELFRAGTIGADPAWGTSVLIAVAWAGGLLVVAAFLHRRFNRVFVDLL
jgi:lipopolysaccharide transport system permease protein